MLRTARCSAGGRRLTRSRTISGRSVERARLALLVGQGGSVPEIAKFAGCTSRQNHKSPGLSERSCAPYPRDEWQFPGYHTTDMEILEDPITCGLFVDIRFPWHGLCAN